MSLSILIRKISLLLYAITLFPLAVSLIQGVQLTQSAFFPILQTIGLIAVIGDGVEKKSISVLAGLALILEIYTYVNFATIVLFPDGLYDAALYAGNYWFLGYKNVMIRFLLVGYTLLFPIALYVGLLYEEEDYESISGRT